MTTPLCRQVSSQVEASPRAQTMHNQQPTSSLDAFGFILTSLPPDHHIPAYLSFSKALEERSNKDNVVLHMDQDVIGVGPIQAHLTLLRSSTRSF